MIVGESAPGSNLHIISVEWLWAFNITYLLSAALITPSNRFIKLTILFCLILFNVTGEIKTASESISELNSTKLLASRVAPDETRSHIQSAIPI